MWKDVTFVPGLVAACIFRPVDMHVRKRRKKKKKKKGKGTKEKGSVYLPNSSFSYDPLLGRLPPLTRPTGEGSKGKKRKKKGKKEKAKKESLPYAEKATRPSTARSSGRKGQRKKEKKKGRVRQHGPGFLILPASFSWTPAIPEERKKGGR